MAKRMVCGIMRDLEAECAAYERKWKQIRLAGAYVKHAQIARVCARFELEPDEFYTAEQKAQALINQGIA